MTNPANPKPFTVYCYQELLYRVYFEVDAHSPEQAIELCKSRVGLDGQCIEPVSEKFIESVGDETDWEAKEEW